MAAQPVERVRIRFFRPELEKEPGSRVAFKQVPRWIRF